MFDRFSQDRQPDRTPPCSAKDSPEGLRELDRLNSPLYLYNLLNSRLDVTIAVLGCQLQCPSVHHAPAGRERNDRPRSAARYLRFLVKKSGCAGIIRAIVGARDIYRFCRAAWSYGALRHSNLSETVSRQGRGFRSCMSVPVYPERQSYKPGYKPETRNGAGRTGCQDLLYRSRLECGRPLDNYI